MAKQTFTTGQVLTAAQMTSLQQTAMGGGSTTAKTASYVLVAADAGTVIQMNAAGATTITVNTALFAAGDSVQIQNIGAGVCTVTAGTATVNTSSTLALKQYDSGDLYFNTTSAAFFFSTDAADSTSPLTTKGDLYGFSTLDARIPVGANNTVLTADSAQALGLKWATPAAASKTWVSLNTGSTALSGSATYTLSSISGYDEFAIFIVGASAGANDYFSVRLNAIAADYQGFGSVITNQSSYATGIFGKYQDTGATSWFLAKQSSNAASTVAGGIRITGGNNTGPKVIFGQGAATTSTGSDPEFYNIHGFNTTVTAAITSIVFRSSSSNFDAGNIYIYGAA